VAVFYCIFKATGIEGGEFVKNGHYLTFWGCSPTYLVDWISRYAYIWLKTVQKGPKHAVKTKSELLKKRC